jgi:hypothetical protein
MGLQENTPSHLGSGVNVLGLHSLRNALLYAVWLWCMVPGSQEDTGLGGKGGELLGATKTCSLRNENLSCNLRSSEDIFALNK